jgi:hypothetical protein
MSTWNPGEVSAQNIYSERRTHEEYADPEAPVTMHPSPVGTRVRFASTIAIAFRIVLIASQLFSIATK